MWEARLLFANTWRGVWKCGGGDAVFIRLAHFFVRGAGNSQSGTHCQLPTSLRFDIVNLLVHLISEHA